MKKIHRQILVNQLEIMNALEYLMMPEKPRQKQYQLTVARRDIRSAMQSTGKMIEQDNIRRTKNHGKEKKDQTIRNEFQLGRCHAANETITSVSDGIEHRDADRHLKGERNRNP